MDQTSTRDVAGRAAGARAQRRGKNIVICCDGTGKEYGRHNTNVVHLFEALERDRRQIALYDPGVGTFNFLGIPLGERLGIMLGQAFGLGLRQNLAETYSFLMDHYRPGDRVFLFGFSRGAFTARALAGMLYKCGLLEQGSKNLVPYAIKLYNQRDNARVAESFKATYCRPCKPYFIGVWDTVASLGWFLGKKFFNAELNPDVTYGYHAMAIDEHRSKFPVSVWDEGAKTDHQTIEQVWFPGSHSDVGGGYPERGLSDLALEWMFEKAAAAGLRLTQRRLEPEPSARGVLHRSRVGAWRLWRPVTRRIAEGARIHRSVFDRMHRDYDDYDPPLPVELEIVEPAAGVAAAGAPAAGLRATGVQPDGPADSATPAAGARRPLDLAPFGHLVERGATGIEFGAERVWRQVRQALSTLPDSVLESLPQEEVRELVGQGLIIDVPAGIMVTPKGSGERELFVVLEGEFEVIDDGRCLSHLGPGEVFGEVAFFQANGRRTASVRASADGRVLVLQNDRVERLIRRRPTLAVPLLHELGSIMAGRVGPRNRAFRRGFDSSTMS